MACRGLVVQRLPLLALEERVLLRQLALQRRQLLLQHHLVFLAALRHLPLRLLLVRERPLEVLAAALRHGELAEEPVVERLEVGGPLLGVTERRRRRPFRFPVRHLRRFKRRDPRLEPLLLPAQRRRAFVRSALLRLRGRPLPLQVAPGAVETLLGPAVRPA